MADNDEQWITYSEDNGVEYHNSEAEAIEFARSFIADYNDGEWNDGVESVFVAKITHTAIQTNVVTKAMLDDEGCYSGRHYGGGYDSWCDYELKPTEATT